MYTVEEVSVQLSVSKVTIYSKLKKYNDKVVLKNGKKYIDADLLRTIKEELKVKDIDNNNLNIGNEPNTLNDYISTHTEDLSSLAKNLTNTLIEQLKVKDKQIDQLHEQITELHRLIENSQILLKEEQQQNNSQLLLEEHFQKVDQKLIDIREKMEQRKKTKKGLFNFFK